MTIATVTECSLLYQSDNWPKILRLTSYWLRVRDRLRKNVVPDKGVPPTTAETTKAMWTLVYWTQRTLFTEEIENLRNHRKCSIKLRKFPLFGQTESTQSGRTPAAFRPALQRKISSALA